MATQRRNEQAPKPVRLQEVRGAMYGTSRLWQLLFNKVAPDRVRLAAARIRPTKRGSAGAWAAVGRYGIGHRQLSGFAHGAAV